MYQYDLHLIKENYIKIKVTHKLCLPARSASRLPPPPSRRSAPPPARLGCFLVSGDERETKESGLNQNEKLIFIIMKMPLNFNKMFIMKTEIFSTIYQFWNKMI